MSDTLALNPNPNPNPNPQLVTSKLQTQQQTQPDTETETINKGKPTFSDFIGISKEFLIHYIRFSVFENAKSPPQTLITKISKMKIMFDAQKLKDLDGVYTKKEGKGKVGEVGDDEFLTVLSTASDDADQNYSTAWEMALAAYFRETDEELALQLLRFLLFMKHDTSRTKFIDAYFSLELYSEKEQFLSNKFWHCEFLE